MARPLDDRAGLEVPAGADTTGVDVFLSHVEEDQAVALQLADALEVAGYSTWCYERDSIPGPSYLLQTSRAIQASRAVVVLISADSLGSHQVTSEVVRAHEEVKPFIPLLIGISREEFGVRQPEWREAIGSAATLDLPGGDVAAVAPRIVEGLTALGVEPHPGAAPRRKVSFAPAVPEAPARAPAAGRSRRRPVLVVALALALVAAATVLFLVLRDDGRPGTSAGSPTPSTTPTQTSGTSPSATPTASTATRDAATTPLQTLGGPARVTARVDTEYCSIGGGACQTAPPGRRFLFLELAPWKAGALTFDEQVSMSAFRAHVTFQGVGVTPVETQMLGGAGSGFTVIFATVPDTAAGADVDLRWPDNPTLRVHVKG